MSNKPTQMPKMARGQRNRFFDAQGVDELVSMVVELTAELSTLRERMYVTERVLESHGIQVAAGIESYVYDQQDELATSAERQRLLGTVFRTLELANLNAATGGTPAPVAVAASTPPSQS